MVYSDSQSAMHMVANPTSERAKHMDIKYHFAKEAVEHGVVQFKYVHMHLRASSWQYDEGTSWTKDRHIQKHDHRGDRDDYSRDNMQ